MLKILTKPGCYFCSALKQALDEQNVNYVTLVDSKALTVPIIYDKNDKILYTGLPPRSELLDIIKKFA